MAEFALVKQPTRLYRHRPLDTSDLFDREMEAIRKYELYFAQFAKLNDPMEGVSRRSLGFRRKDVDKHTYDKIVKTKETMGICSFSDAFNNELMWAHYSSNYTGICVGYRTDSLLQGLDDNIVLVRMQYADRSPLLSKKDSTDVRTAAQ